jgi:hypothetical protein
MSRSTLSHTRQSLLMSSSANPCSSETTKYLSTPPSSSFSKKVLAQMGTQTEGEGREDGEVRERLAEAEERC